MALERNTKKKKQTHTHDRRNIWLLVVALLLVVISVFTFTPLNERINLGLDIQGGLSVVLTASSDTDEEITTDDMEASRAIIENRVNALGATEATVQVQGTDQILVQIPGLSDTEQALATIGKTGSLVFARLDTFTDEDAVTSIENGSYANEITYTDDFGNTFPSGQYNYLEVEEGTYTPLITGSNITSVSVDRASDTSTDYAVNISLDSEGTSAFAQATEDLVDDHGQIVIILDNEVQSAPAVQSVITGGQVSITGNYSLEDAQSLETILESGSLPISFEYSQSQVVGPTLGQDALFVGIMVMIIGLILVMLYLIIFYKGLGLITAAAMIVFAVIYLGILAVLSGFSQFSLTLAGLAGIVLTIGMAADSSVLTLERFREEIRMGRSVRAASITGVRHAIFTSIDADLVTLVSALVLFFLASASVRGFGLTLAIGIVCDIVMMLVFKAPIIRLLAPRIIARHPGFWGIKDSLNAADYINAINKDGLTGEELAQMSPEEVSELVAETEAAEGAEFAEGANAAAATAADATATEENVEQVDAIDPDEVESISEAAQASYVGRAATKIKGRFIKHDINFVGHRRVFLIIAACCMVACFAFVGIRGLSFGIEFVGGTSITFYGTEGVSLDEMRSAFDDAGEPDAVIQTTSTNGEEGFLIRTTTTDAEEAATAANEVADEFGLSTENYEVTTIGADWGPSVIQASLIAFLVAIILIIIYIAIRFEYKMGLVAIVALLHDLIIVMGIYALIGWEVTPNTIAALLTILGYSLYDTVVVFHRINDNMQGENIRCTFASMANHSLNQVFIRTINTTLTSFIPVLFMLIFGGETLQGFALAIAIGLIAGSYSSIAVATPIFVIWKTHEKRYAKLQKKYGKKIALFNFYQTTTESLVQVPLSRKARATKAVAATTATTEATVTTTTTSTTTATETKASPTKNQQSQQQKQQQQKQQQKSQQQKQQNSGNRRGGNNRRRKKKKKGKSHR